MDDDINPRWAAGKTLKPWQPAYMVISFSEIEEKKIKTKNIKLIIRYASAMRAMANSSAAIINNALHEARRNAYLKDSSVLYQQQLDTLKIPGKNAKRKA